MVYHALPVLQAPQVRVLGERKQRDGTMVRWEGKCLPRASSSAGSASQGSDDQKLDRTQESALKSARGLKNNNNTSNGNNSNKNNINNNNNSNNSHNNNNINSNKTAAAKTIATATTDQDNNNNINDNSSTNNNSGT